ncbi:putative immunity protein [Rhodococcus sp. 077-4]|uniref:putative immunity protein n=1 Tax=Rhodococcus sp. 077-4 TaxID=2789271 RepID=UPI0039F54816
MILPAVRDPRLITVHRGGLLSDDDHRSLALWAAECAEHVLALFERAEPSDSRPRDAIEAARSWARGERAMMATRALGGHAMGAARLLRGAERFAAYAAGQAACVAHVAEHDLGAAAYAIKAVRAAAHPGREVIAGREEREWQRDRLPQSVRELVLEDQQKRSGICWSVFDD